MSTLAGTDAFLVSRAGVNYQVTAANFMSTVLDTDLFVVNRGTVNYKVTGLDAKAYFAGGGPLQPGESAILPKCIGTVGAGTGGIAARAPSSNMIVWNSSYYFLFAKPYQSGSTTTNDGRALWRSADLKVWERLESSVDYTGSAAGLTYITTPSGSVIFASASSATKGLYRSADNGTTFTQTLVSGLSSNGGLLWNTVSSKILFIQGNTTYESTDDGLSWVATSPNGLPMAATPTNPAAVVQTSSGDLLYNIPFSGTNRVWRSDPNGLNFTVGRQVSTGGTWMAISSDKTKIITGGNGALIQYTTDEFASAPTNPGIAADTYSAAAWSTANSCFVICSSADQVTAVPQVNVKTFDGTTVTDITNLDPVVINPTYFADANGTSIFASYVDPVLWCPTIL